MINFRKFRRVNMELPVEVVNRLGERRQARLINLSLEGLMLVSNAAGHAHVLKEPDDPSVPPFPVKVRVRFSLPRSQKSEYLHLLCSHAHTRRLSQDAFQIGFRTLQFEGDSRRQIESFIRSWDTGDNG